MRFVCKRQHGRWLVATLIAGRVAHIIAPTLPLALAQCSALRMEAAA